MSQGEFSRAAALWPGFASLPAAGAGGVGNAGNAGNARAAIARAAQATGVDFTYLLAQARLESSLDPNARAQTSSAAGLFQFTQGTWAQMLQQHGSEIGLGGSTPGGTLAALRDPAQRAQLMALRFDPETSARMAAALAGDNQAALTAQLGRAPKPAELYLAHFLGSDGAAKFLGALGADPSQSAAALMPKAAGANRSIFYDAGGSPRSVGAVMALIEQKMASAMGEAGRDAASFDPSAFATLDAATPSAPVPTPGVTPGWAGSLGREFASAQASASPSAVPASAPPRQASMADTLGAAFGLGEATGSQTPEFVRSAYGRLRALGL